MRRFELYETRASSSDQEYDDWAEDYDALLARNVISYRNNYDFADKKIAKDPTNLLEERAIAGDLIKIIEIMDSINWNVNASFPSTRTLLHIACEEAHYEVVRYLVIDRNAKVNNEINTQTPLMFTCNSDSRNHGTLLNICQLLVQCGASLENRDCNGTNALMMACRKGHTAIVQWLITKVDIDACDTRYNNALFYAIEGNQPEIVRILLMNGVQSDSRAPTNSNIKVFGKLYGSIDILESLASAEDPWKNVPSNHVIYSTISDYIPRCFPNRKCPEYFQDITVLLPAMSLCNYLQNFVREQISLSQFLCLEDEDLKKLNFKYDFQRIGFKKCLLDFHLHHWLYKSIGHINDNTRKNFGSFLVMIGNHTQTLIIMKSTLHYVLQNIMGNRLGPGHVAPIINLRKHLNNYRESLIAIRDSCKYMTALHSKLNPLHIDYKHSSTRKKCNQFKRYLTYTTVLISISVIISLQYKRLIK